MVWVFFFFIFNNLAFEISQGKGDLPLTWIRRKPRHKSKILLNFSMLFYTVPWLHQLFFSKQWSCNCSDKIWGRHRGFLPPHPSSAKRETFFHTRLIEKASNPARAKQWAAQWVPPVLQETYLSPRQEARRAGEALAAPNEGGARTLWIHLLPRGENQPVWHPHLQSRVWCCGSSSSL